MRPPPPPAAGARSSMTAAPALDISGLTSGYRGSVVIRGVDVQVGEGEIVAILGKNGMGKSTLLKTVMGFLAASSGRVSLLGEDVTNLATHIIARRSIAYAPQEQTLFQDLTVEENLRLGLRSDKEFATALASVADYFPVISQRLKQRAGTLSGGEQKMLVVMRTLAKRPAVILVDEISEGLQPSMIQRLADVFLAERQRRGMSILLVEQNVAFATAVADRYAILKIGEITARGDAKDGRGRADIDQHMNV